MAIRTNISVSAFNIIRYFVLGIALDFIVRKSLDSFEHFRRRVLLHRGRPVSITGPRIDRYNTFRILRSGHLLSASLLLFVTVLAYTAELALEYAVDSTAIRYAIPGNVTRVEQRNGVCSREEMVASGNALDVAFIADQCVIWEDNTYRLYRPIWAASTSANDRVNDNGLRVICEAVDDNILYEGDGIYSPSTTSKQSPEVLELIHTLSDNSYKTIGDAFLPLFVLNVSSRDVFQTIPFATPLEQFSVSFLLTDVAATSVRCMGFAAGVQRKDTLMVQVVACLNGFGEDSSLVLTYGSSFVEVGSNNDAAGGSNDWSTLVGFEVRTRIPRYFEGIRKDASSQATADGYSTFLARAFPQDVINLNKYAITYRFCDQMPLPVRNGTSWHEEYEFASSEKRVTATVEEWAITLAACWVTVVAVAHLLVSLVAAWKKMPNHVFGEHDILRRWAEENNGKQMEGTTVAWLCVDGGSKGGRITATLKRV